MKKETVMSFRSSKDVFRQYLISCSDAYYNEQPIVSDAVFDKLQSEYEKTYKEEFNYIGSIYHKHHQKVTLPFETPSLTKIKETSAIVRFAQKSTSSTSYVLSEKLDGFSLIIDYTPNGTFLYTRGSGTVGADVTHLLRFLPFPPQDRVLAVFGDKMKDSDTHLCIRGELVLPKSFDGTNLRNAISGVVNAKHPRLEICKGVHFVAHGVQSIPLTPSETFTLCAKAGFKVPMHKVVKSLTHDMCDETLTSFLATSIYPMDGLVVARNVAMPVVINTDDSETSTGPATPNDVVAYKRSGETRTTTVKKIHWEQSRYGSLHPRVEIVPIDIDGCTISFCSGFHARFIVDNKLGPGSIIEVQRSGGVIPDIVEVLQPTQAQMPSTPYTWNGVHIQASGVSEEQEISRLVHSFKILEAEGCSEKTFEKLYKAGFTNEIQCWSATRDQLCKIDGIQSKSASNLIKAFETSKANLTLVKLLQCSACFPGMKTKLESISESMNICAYLLDKDTYTTKKIEDICAKLSIYKAVTTFIDGCNTFRNTPHFMTMLNMIATSSTSESSSSSTSTLTSTSSSTSASTSASTSSSSSSLATKLGKVCFTGFRDKELKKRAVEKGYDVVDSFSKQLTLLVCDSLSSSSTKITQAKAAGIKVVSKDQFEAMCIV